jgi:RNA polymerase sigma factor (sigma-70 family)
MLASSEIVRSDGDRFPTTRSSAVLGARSGDPLERERSWAALARAYWKPAYKHVRVTLGASPEDAEDLVQGFFERSMEKELFSSYQPARARFRTFFRVCLDRYAANEAKGRRRQKRGGAVSPLGLEAEDELAKAGAPAFQSPDECFDREWRREIVALSVVELRAECEAKDKTTAYLLFERYDLADPGSRPTYEVLAKELALPVTTVTNHLAYARRELRRIALTKLESVTATDAELRAEARALFG